MQHLNRRMHRLAPLLALTLLGLAGCDTMQSMLAAADKPTARVTNATLQNLTLDGATINFDLEIANPYSVPLPLTNLTYALASGGANFLTGTAPVQGVVPAKSTRTVNLPATVAFAELMKASQGVRPGAVVPYAAEMILNVDAPGVGPIALPLKKQGQIPVPAPPRVEVQQIRWDELTLDNAAATLKLMVTNTNDFPVDLQKLDYHLDLGGSPVAHSSIARAVKFDRGGTQPIEVPLSFSPTKLGLAAFNMLRGREAGYKISGTFDASTPFGPMSLPFSQIGKTALTSK